MNSARIEKIAVFIFLLVAIPLSAYIVGMRFPASRPAPGVTPNVLHPIKYDPNGRDIFYTTLDATGTAQRSAYAGIGLHFLGENTNFYEDDGTLLKTVNASNMLAHIVGIFEKWEDIPGSTDKYLTLAQPDGVEIQNNRKYGQSLPIPKVRVGFSEQPEGNTAYITRIHVEELSSVIPVFKGEKVQTHFIGLMHTLTADQLNALIKPGDAVAVQLYLDFKTNSNLLDNNGNRVVSDLFIRRFNAIDQVYKESGIVIKQ